ncbi:MAG: hypothetical protein HKN33_02020 [Pyrinomonadaceae bacterium]|nr:hypothetical protein [Pyrinomonadaceae bacterium]
MADYKEQFEKWQKQAKERFEELDEQLGFSDKVGEGVKIAKDTATKGSETIKEGVGKLKSEAEKNPIGKKAVEIAEDTYETAEETAKKAWEVSEPVREAAEDATDAAGDVIDSAAKNAGDVAKTAGRKAGEVIDTAGKKAGEVLGETRKGVESTTKSFAKALGLGVSWTRTIDSAFRTLSTTSNWVQEKPLQAVATGASVAVGAGLGVVFTGLSSHWFFNSAIPAATVKFAASRFDEHLKNQAELAEKGDLDDAEAERLKFERDITRFVGAPLLGAFSFASGAVMLTNVINPKTVTGAPIDWLLRGSPLLEGVWFFGNGMVCFKTSYDFFMISLQDQDDVQNMVKQVRGLLPVGSEA